MVNSNSNIAMILERPDLGHLYAQMAYVRILEAGSIEPFDASIGGDIAAYLKRFHQAVLVDAPTFMEEWNIRREEAKLKREHADSCTCDECVLRKYHQ